MINLTEEQIIAITWQDGYVLLIAGPGSGKTTVLSEKVIYYINKGVFEYRIQAFTFTNKATYQMERRIKDKLGREHSVKISNFHSYTYQKLKEYYGFNILVVTDSERKNIITNLILEKGYKLNRDEVASEIARIKNLLPLKEEKINIRLQILDIYYAYEDYLKYINKIDFDGMNLEFLRLLKEDVNFRNNIKSETDYILVDEAQDINWVQYEMLLIMAEDHHNLFLIGDPNQAIYGFRGSDVTILEDFVERFDAKVLHLSLNHRSTPQIVNIANNLIENNTNKFNLPLKSTLPDGDEFVYKKAPFLINEAEYVAFLIKKMVQNKEYNYSDIFILYRQNQTKGIFDAILNKNLIPHYASGIGFLEYREIKYILGYCKLILNHNDNEAFSSVCNFPPRGIADVLMSQIRLKAIVTKKSYYECAKELNNETLNLFIKLIDDLTDYAKHHNEIELFDEIAKIVDLKKLTKEYYDLKRRENNVSALKGMLEQALEEGKSLIDFINELSLKAKPDDINNVVRLMTIHQAKGLEAKVVFIVEAKESLMPGNKKGLEIEEERNVFYVGVTRARERLYIFLSEKHNSLEKKAKAVPSRFIRELENKKKEDAPSS